MTAWPKDKVDRLTDLWNAGIATPRIAATLGTTVKNINNMVRVCRGRGIGLALRGNSSAKPISLRDYRVELRPCLGFCGGEFYTTVQIRVCPSCTNRQKSVGYV